MMDTGLQVRETPTGLEVRLHVLPRAKRCEVSGVHNGALKVRVTAPPIDDAANRAIVEFFSASLGISKSSLSILSGFKSRDKVLQIRGLSLRSFLQHFDVLS
jgi:uncharacterized protein (TIGR00251 family)